MAETEAVAEAAAVASPEVVKAAAPAGSCRRGEDGAGDWYRNGPTREFDPPCPYGNTLMPCEDARCVVYENDDA
jgi:hypothetical protein